MLGSIGNILRGPWLRLSATAVLLCAINQQVHATHAMGGELSYECIGANTYRVTLAFYRDCNGVAAPTNCNNGLQFNLSSSQCGANLNQCFTLQSVSVITPICSSEIDRCLSSQGTYGVERYIFTKVVDLSAWAGCGTDWVISWGLCCRNNAITSLQNPGNQQLYLDAQLNNTLAVCNTSPQFLTAPTPFYCIGQSVSYNPGAFDVDGDSLAYSLIGARGAGGVNLAYTNGYSAQQPILNSGGMNAVQVNPITGTMTVVPSITQVAVVTYRIREFRNGVQIGQVTRDVQVVVRSCAGNTAPTATGINGTNTYNTSVCAGQPISFTINSSDPNAGQTVQMTWNNGIQNATFSANGSPFPTGTFSWTPGINNIGNNLFTVTVTDDACPLIGTNDFGYSIQVTPPLTPANAGPDQSVCGTSATLAGQLPYSQVQGTWSVISGSGTFSNPNSPTAQVTGLSQGANVFQWSVNYLTCGVTTDQVTITSFNAGQAAANAGPDQSLCLPTNSTTLAANIAVAPATGTWTLVNGAGTFLNANDPNTSVTGLAVGANTFRWTVNNGPCGTPTTDQITVLVYSNLQASASAGGDQQLCSPNTSTALAGNSVISPAIGTWTVITGTGTFANANAPGTQVSGLSIGANTFRWTINNGPCTPAFTNDDVVITVFDPNSPNANAGPDLQLCSPPNSITLTGSAPISPATGMWTLVSGTGAITSPGSPSTLVTGLGIGNNIFQWTVNNGPCANGITSDQVIVSVFSSASPAANAGPDQTLCSTSNSTALAGNAPIFPATGTWTLQSGTGTITSPNSPTSQVTGLGIGVNVFRWTVNNGPCAVGITNDQVLITVYDANAVTANAGPDQQLCSSTATTNLAGNAPTFPSTGTWTLVSGSGTIATPGSPTSQVSGLGLGNNVFQWTINNGPCQNPITNDQITITVFPASNPVSNAGPDQSLCGSLTTVMAGSAVTAPATGVWTLVSGSGTIASPGSPTTQITAMAIGANVFRWTVNNGPCSGATTDDVTIFVYDQNLPVANAGPDQQLCTPTTSTTMVGSAIVFPAVGTWSLTGGSGTIVSPNSPTTSITGLGVGVNTFQWQVNNGPCGVPTTDQITITVFDQNVPAANAGPDVAICVPTVPNEVTLQGSAVIAPAVGTWTVVNGTGVFANANAPNTLVTGLAIGINTFRWTVSNGVCANSLTTDQVVVSVFDAANPNANAGPDQSLCTPVTTTVLQGSLLTVPATGTWTLVSGSGTIASPNSSNTQISGLALGSNVFQWTVNNGPCANGITSDQVTIDLFNGSAQQAEAGLDQTICNTTSSVALDGNAPVGLATGQWSVVQGTATFADAAVFNTTATGLSIGVNVLQWTINNGACGLSSDQITITVFDDAQVVANAGPDQEICVPVAPSQVNLQGSSVAVPAVGTWTLISGTGTIDDPNDPNTLVTGLAVGVNVFQWTVDNGPCTSGITTDQVSIFVFDAANPVANAGPDQQWCTPTTSTTLAGSSLIFPAQGTWTLQSGAGAITNVNDPSTTVTGLAIGVNVFRWTVDNGPCTPSTTFDEVTILLFDENNPDADAGPDQDICETTTSVTLTGSAVTVPATGMWEVVAGSGIFTNATSSTTDVSGLSVGENIFTWTVLNGPCVNGNTMDAVSVFVYSEANPVANAGPDQDLCTPTTSTTLAGSSLIFPATGTWTVQNGTGVFGDPNDPNTGVTGLSIGENIFVWTVDNGPCSAGTTVDQVSIFLFDGGLGAANAGPDQSLCAPNTSTTMAGSAVVFPAIGTWTLVSGGGNIVDVNEPNTIIDNLPIGENVFRWTVSNGPCAGPLTVDEVSIFIFDPNNPVADAGADQELCTPDESAVMSAPGVIFPAVGTWTLTSGTGTISDPNDPTTTITGLGIGENIFEWTVNNGPCATGITTDQVSIFVFDANNPNANAGPDQEICTPSSSTFMAGSAITFPSTGTWTLVNGTGVFANANDPNSEVTGLTIGENIFQWTVENGPCANGFTTDQVSIFVFDENNPDADAGPDQDLCSPTSTTTLAGSALTFPATGLWNVISGTASITNPTDPNSTVSDLTVGLHILEWIVSNGPCANGITTDQMTILVYDENTPVADAGPDQDLCTPTTSTTLAASAAIFPAVGTWSVQGGNGTFTDPNDPNTTVSGLQVGENIFVWTVDNGPCATGSTSDLVSIFLYDANNLVSNAGPDQDLCSPNFSTTLAGSTLIFPATGMWTLAGGTGTIADPTDPNSAVSDLSIGENIFLWTVDNGPCANPITTDLVSIFVFDENNPNADAGPDQEICTPVTSATLAGSTLIFPATGTWSLVGGAGTITDPTDPNTTVTGLGIGLNVFEWTVGNGPCANAITMDQVGILLFDENAPPANAGPDQEFCTPTSTATLAGNPPVGVATGTWSLTQGTGSFDDVNDPTSGVTGLTVGENIFTWTMDNSVCGISTDDVSIFIFDENNPAADAGLDQELCVPADSTFLQGNTPIFPATGEWTLINGTGSFADDSDPGTLVSGLSIGPNTFRWTVDNGPCANPITFDEVTIVLFDDSTAAADAGPDLEVCLPQTTTVMGAAIPQPPATGMWSLLSGTGTIVDPADPSTAITDLGVGISVFLWTLDNGPCPDYGILTDTMSIYIYDPSAPVADAGPDQEWCTPTDTTNLQGNTPLFPGVGTWTLFSGTGTFTDVNDPATLVSGLTVGENIFVWTIYNGMCGFGPPSTDTVSVFIFDENQTPAATGADQELCTPQTDTQLSANAVIFPATGTWEVIQGGALLADANDPNTTVSGLTVGENIFVWTIDNGPCANAVTSDTTVVSLFDSNAPVADAGPDQEICIPTFPNEVTMAGSVPTFPAIGTWTLVSGSGTIADPNDPNTLITDLTVGVHVFQWSIMNGPCPNGATTDQITISVFDASQPDADAGADVELCTPDNSYQLQGNSVIFPATGNWTIVSGSGTIGAPGQPDATITGLTVGQTILVWTIDNGPCANGLTTDTMTISIFDDQAPSALAGDDQDFCSPTDNTTMFASSAVFPAVGTWMLLSGSGVIADPNDPFSAISGLGLGENIFEWTIDNGVCGSSSDQMTIRIFDSAVPPADAGASQLFCAHEFTSAFLDAEPVSGLATGSWSVVQGTATIGDPTASGSEVTALGAGINILQWTVSNGPCGTTSDTLVIELDDCLTLIIPDAFSPNGDGVNDTYVIDNLEYYPSNSIQVFNRWGSKVVDRKPYRNDWDGKSENSLNWGEALPESTYYMILDLGNGEEPYTGFIYLRR